MRPTKKTIYSKRPNLILGFHGCDESLIAPLVLGQTELKPSQNKYDWLGPGIYFWENNHSRALEYARSLQQREPDKVKQPAVVGAIINLGNCLDLTDSEYLDEVKDAYKFTVDLYKEMGFPLPENKNVGQSTDELLRYLDCAVIRTLHQMNERVNAPTYDSIKGSFIEGSPLYPGAGFKDKNHIQLCICNPNCILGYFKPKL